MDFDPYETWLGIPADLRPPTCYDLLGLASHEPDLAAIEIAALRRMGKVRLHQDGPHSDRIQEVVDELARARSILMDSNLRTRYDAELQACRQHRIDSAAAPDNAGGEFEAVDRPEPASPLADDFGALVITEEPGAHALRESAAAGPRSSWLKKAVLYSAMVASHALLLGAFLLYVSFSPNFNWKPPWAAKNNADAQNSRRVPPSSLTSTGDAQNQEEQATIVAARPADPASHGFTGGRTNGEPLRSEPTAKTTSMNPKPGVQASRKTEPSSVQKKLDRPRTKSSSRSVAPRFSTRPVQVKPVFILPRGAPEPTPEQKKALADHLAWCQTRFNEMLSGADTFTLEKSAPLVSRSKTSLTELRAAPEMGAPRLTGELLTVTKFNRLDCPFIFVAVVMNDDDNFPGGGGRPLNGGFNTGGGIVLLSSFALSKHPNFQSTLEHELGHGFGLPHVDVYGHDMTTSASIMSYNPAHHTRGMQPSATPGALTREDLLGLSLNRRAFPKLAATRPRDNSPAGNLRPIVPLGPMTIDGQPPYELTIKTESGETFGTKVSNIVQKHIPPNIEMKFDPSSMWQSAPSQTGAATVLVTFPLPVALTAIGVHSQHSGTYNAADRVQVEAFGKDGFLPVADSALHLTDAIVPLFEPATAKTWRLTFHAENNKEVTLRGIQFFAPYGELFPPPVPADNDAGFAR